jgi:glyceraldehyde 3-phosphate dehydrogenase
MPGPLQGHLLAWDSEYGPFPATIEAGTDSLHIDGVEIRLFQQRNPDEIDWSSRGVDVVIESTGRFLAREQAAAHLSGSVKKVLISANGRDEDITLIYGINHDAYDPKTHRVIAAASCTTNCTVPVARLLYDHFGIRHAALTTVHAYTGDQNLTDGEHRDWRRARAAHNIIPTSTGAAEAVGAFIPELRGKVDGLAMRVPTSAVSVVDFVAELEQPASVEALNEMFAEAAEGTLRGVLYFQAAPLVSNDYRQHPGSSIVDGPATQVIDQTLGKVLSWYDN